MIARPPTPLVLFESIATGYPMPPISNTQSDPGLFLWLMGRWIERRRNDIDLTQRAIAEAPEMDLSQGGVDYVEDGLSPTLDHYLNLLSYEGLDVFPVSVSVNAILIDIKQQEMLLGRDLDEDERQGIFERHYQKGPDYTGPTDINPPRLYRFVLGWLIKQVRKSAKVTQAQLADLLSIKQPSVSDLEKGRTPTAELYIEAFDRLGKDFAMATGMARIGVRHIQLEEQRLGREMAEKEMAQVCSNFYVAWRAA